MPCPVPPGVMVRNQVPIISTIHDGRKPYNTVSSWMKLGPDMTRFEQMEINKRAFWTANVSSLDIQHMIIRVMNGKKVVANSRRSFRRSLMGQWTRQTFQRND